MARRRKKKDSPGEAGGPKPPKPVKTSLAGLLRDVTLEPEPEAPSPPRSKPAPSPPTPPKRASAPDEARSDAGPARPSDGLRGDDRIAFHQAMDGVRPIRPRDPAARRPERVSAPPPDVNDDEEVRARLGALVAGDVRFEIARDGDRVLGRRAGLPLRLADDLSRKGVVPEATLDLHGMTTADVTRALVRWLRAQRERGARHVCVVHGKGQHSETGLSTLREHTVHVLTEGGAAPVVRAFASAHRTLGGTGALIVLLEG